MLNDWELYFGIFSVHGNSPALADGGMDKEIDGKADRGVTEVHTSMQTAERIIVQF